MPERQLTKSRLEAKEKIEAQILKGKELREKGIATIKGKYSHEVPPRERDNFETLFEQWERFTVEILEEIFVSSHYPYEFKEKRSSEVEYVGSDWIPDIEYYLEKELIPKIDYLEILQSNLNEFEEPSTDEHRGITKKPKLNSSELNEDLKLPEKVTLAWLWHNVPAKFWLWSLGILIAVFLFGITVGQVRWVQEICYLTGLFTEKVKQSTISEIDVAVQDNEDKLAQVAEVNENQIIVNRRAGVNALKMLEGEDLGWAHYYASLIEKYEETTKLITIIISSERFGRKIKLTVPSEIRVWALKRMITKALILPQWEVIEELGISVQFVYTLITDAPLGNNQTLLEAGIDSATELNVQIDVIIRDPHLEKLDAELQKMYSTHFARSPGPEWYERRRRLAQEGAELRQKLYEKYAEEILKKPWFAYINKLRENRPH